MHIWIRWIAAVAASTSTRRTHLLDYGKTCRFAPFQAIHITLAWDKTNDVKQTIFVNIRASTYIPAVSLPTHTAAHGRIYILNKFLSICLIQQKILQPPPVVIHESHMCRQAQLFFWMFIWHIPRTTYTRRRCSRRGAAVTAKYLSKIPTIYAHFTRHM